MSPHPDPAQLLIDYVSILPKGKALDVAMGKGRNALFLAYHGFEVVGIEIDEEAIEICRSDAEKRGFHVEIRRVDLENLASYKIEVSAYDIVICFYYLQRNLIPQMKEALKPGGIILYETFLIDQHLKAGHPRHREYCFEHNELLKFFLDFRVLFYHEGQDTKGTYKASLVAQKPVKF